MANLKPRLKIIVGLSGGVDSSVAAYLLKEAGHHVEGVFMKNWEDSTTFCSAAEDFSDAQKVCDQLNIPLNMVNFSDQYWEKVFSLFLDEYKKGRTPNPDILCNKEIKFNAFLNYAKQRDADFIATGHYARVTDEKNAIFLQKSCDLQKDQTYFLYALNKEQLKQSLFPIGHLNKTEVRKIAKQLGLPNHAKKDSTGICFIGERKFKQFLNEFLPAQSGNIETTHGEVVGQHHGLMFYTLGQRQGLQIGGKKGKAEQPWYVVKKDLTRNVLIVTQGDHPDLYRKHVFLTHIHWINHIPELPIKVTAKIRYRQTDQVCFINPNENSQYQIIFSEPQRAPTPGQSIVFYQNDICLGGGIIEIE